MAKNYTMLDDLKRSGLTQADAKKLKLKPLTKAQTRQLVKKPLAGYQIPYFSLEGRPLDFYRIRFLETPNGFSGAQTKPQRYTQPSKTEPHLYLPPTEDWKVISGSTDIPIIITEGEKKAAKVCKVGYPCIGLGGVWSFRAKEQRPLLDEFSQFQWADREVSIIYDSDLVSNPAVQKAMQVLAHELTQLGAYVWVGYVPPDNDDKQGLDDYLVRGGDIQNVQLENFAECQALWELNEDVSYVQNPGRFYQFSTGLFFKAPELCNSVYSNRFYIADTEDGPKPIATAPRWLKWPNRRTHKQLVYAPGQPTILTDTSLNTWKGWGCEPVQGDVAPFTKLIDYIFSNDAELKKWFWQWLAYPIQNPGSKQYSSVLLWSTAQGTGKTFVGYIMEKIYGDNFNEVGQEMLHGTFNEWAVNRQFVLGDEITGSDKKGDAARLKTIVTRNKLTVNAKFQPAYKIDDCINYLFTSQHPDGLFLEDKDRRFAIHEITGDPLPRTFYKQLNEWKNGTGPSHLFHHLLHEIDCSNFDPLDHAPDSLSKQDMISLSKSDIDLFCDILKHDPDQILNNGKYKLDRDLYTASEVVELYDPDGMKRTAVIAMSKALSRAGFRQLPMTRTASGNKRLWPLRRCEHWYKAESFERIENYDKSVVHFNKAKEKYLRDKKEGK